MAHKLCYNAPMVRVTRFAENPIIKPNMDARMGGNVNGPSLIRVPEWIEKPLGKYYLYFAHHKGEYIRLAYADSLHGPWRTYEPGTLQLAQSPWNHHHVASPDVHIDDRERRIRMYYHGPVRGKGQLSFVALSDDGIHFTARPEVLGLFYMRAFQWQGWHYALSMPGQFYRSADGLTGFEEGPSPFPPNMRHNALLLIGDTLHVFYSNYQNRPERMLLSKVKLMEGWRDWRPTKPVTVLKPERQYEGADLPMKTSAKGWAPERVRQIRDPAIFLEDGRVYLLYSVAGESGIGISEVTL